MELEDYRILHSKIIEQYQYIEFHLEGLFALMAGQGNNFKELAQRVENDAMGELIRKVRFLVKQYNYQNIITKQDFKNLEIIRDDRNYYCHENFLNNITENYKTDRKTNILQDLDLVLSVNEKLVNAFKEIRSATN